MVCLRCISRIGFGRQVFCNFSMERNGAYWLDLVWFGFGWTECRKFAGPTRGFMERIGGRRTVGNHWYI